MAEIKSGWDLGTRLFSMYNEAVHVAMYNQAVPNLPCSPNAQSSMQLSCSQCTQYTFTNVEHLHELEASCKPPLSCTLPKSHQHLITGSSCSPPEKEKEICNLPMYKNRILSPTPRISCSSAVPSPLVTQVTQCKGCKLRNACRCVHASTLTIIK